MGIQESSTDKEMSMNKSMRTWFAIPALALGSPILAGEIDFETLCDDFEPKAEAEIAAIGNLQIHRGSFDFEGTRVVGCIENRGVEPLQNPSLVYDNIQRRGGGGGSTGISAGDLPSGEIAAFQTSHFTANAQRIEDRGLEGIRIRSLQVQDGMDRNSFEFSNRIELDYPYRPLPDSELASNCAEEAQQAPDDEIALTRLKLIEISPGQVHIAGCIINGLDKVLADGLRHRAAVRYSGDASEDHEGMRAWGGSGRVTLPDALEPGQASVFLSQFDVPDDIARVEITPMRRVDQNGIFTTEPGGSPASLQRE
jgi:hypothetical protein